jgi:hypothetical protein
MYLRPTTWFRNWAFRLPTMQLVQSADVEREGERQRELTELPRDLETLE